MSGLKDKVVIITGSSSGIGAETAVQFAKVGARVVLTARTEAKLKETADKCCQTGLDRSKILIVVGDILKEEDLQNLVTTTIDKFGVIDVLVNNAGYSNFHNFKSTTLEDMDIMYKVHVRSPFRLTKLVLPYLIKQKGNVVNVSSVAGLRPKPNYFAYSVAKCAQDHFTKAAALEMGEEGVRLNSVCPGTIRTEIFTSGDSVPTEGVEEFLVKMGQRYPSKRIGTTEEVAKAIVFLASDDASFISGVTLALDSGFHNTTA